MDFPDKSHPARIVAAVEEEILAGRLVPGDRLDERSLADQFGVSRTPVREALQRMSASGVVQLAGRQGARVAQLDLADLLDAFVLIAELEALAAAQAARRLRPDQRLRLEALNAETAQAAREGEVAAFNEANARFHAAIMEASQNRLLWSQARVSQLLTSAYRRHATRQPGRMVASIDEHAAITGAICAGDAAAAGAQMRAHVNHLAEGVGDFLHQLRDSPLGSDAFHIAPAPPRTRPESPPDGPASDGSAPLPGPLG